MPTTCVFHDNDALKDAIGLWCSSEGRCLATERYGHISTWDTSQITSMSKKFFQKYKFNDDIS
ncbi:BspA family leucine-rich repeat surface protein [archaeon]|nr:MAG: BspA family leucine-rich repeat surface protein [archaeon]